MNYLLAIAYYYTRKVTYPVLAEDRVHRRIHIPEYPAEDLCEFPKSSANQLSTSANQIERNV